MNEKQIEGPPLSEATSELIWRYLNASGNGVIDLHRMILEQFEPALIETVMLNCRYNQSSPCFGIKSWNIAWTFKKIL